MSRRLGGNRFEGARPARPFVQAHEPVSAAAPDETHFAPPPLRDVPTAPVPEVRAAVETSSSFARAGGAEVSGADAPARACPSSELAPEQVRHFEQCWTSEDDRVQGGEPATSEACHFDTSQRGAGSPTQQSVVLGGPVDSAVGFA